ncbi:hypothetical protein QUA70_03195 [Microcoleus sp. LAD1_D5]|uniref:hypothetical protein n=1 Tax=unclassified Microcoleus TaxID=2642155 RepID=UPI002FCF0307
MSELVVDSGRTSHGNSYVAIAAQHIAPSPEQSMNYLLSCNGCRSPVSPNAPRSRSQYQILQNYLWIDMSMPASQH